LKFLKLVFADLSKCKKITAKTTGKKGGKTTVVDSTVTCPAKTKLKEI